MTRLATLTAAGFTMNTLMSALMPNYARAEDVLERSAPAAALDPFAGGGDFCLGQDLIELQDAPCPPSPGGQSVRRNSPPTSTAGFAVRMPETNLSRPGPIEYDERPA
jgi:hypothetical protein